LAGSTATDGGSSIFAGLTGAGGTGGGTMMTATAVLGQQAGRGSGGSASGGDLNIPGETAHFGFANPHNRPGVGWAGVGGGSALAMGGVGAYSGTLADGVAGNFPGGGAAGGICGASQATPGVGGIGGAGCIILTEYF
jgi:hypothetical protein